ncbi:hypothetical protein TNCV_951641 [Trichonephila clavipes]|nr:hypothetical protein TNCV_951641 [Trichonephila clavipes]
MSFDILGNPVPDWKCVLLWMDAFRATRKVSKEKGKYLRKTIRTHENVEMFLCQFRPICDNDPTIMFNRSPKRDLDNVITTRRGYNSISRVSMGV